MALMPTANGADGTGNRMTFVQKVASQPDIVLLDTPIGMDLDQRKYHVSRAMIESTGVKPTFQLEMGTNDLIKVFIVTKNTRYGYV